MAENTNPYCRRLLVEEPKLSFIEGYEGPHKNKLYLITRWVHVVPENNIYLQNYQVGNLEGKTTSDIFM